jgi:type IV secretory pathway VirB4 component
VALRIRLRRRRADRAVSDEQLLALGARSLADLIAPTAFEIRDNHLQLDAQYLRVLAVTGYPRAVAPGWLSPLVEFEQPIDVSLHVRPLETGAMARLLGHRLVTLESSRLMDARGGRLPDPEREVAIEDAERLRDALQRGTERMFSVSLYLLVRAASRRALDELTRRVEAQLDSLLAHSRVALWEQERGFRSCLPEGRDELLVPRNLDTSSLATTLPIGGSSVSMERGMLYGVSPRTQTPVIIDPWDPALLNANLAVFAMAGAGKSYFVKLMALRNLVAGIDFLVIDPEDEYCALCAEVGGQSVRLASSSPHRLNPFELPGSTEDVTRPVDDLAPLDVLAEKVAELLGLLQVMVSDAGAELNTAGRAVLDRALFQTYAAAGITRDPATHDRPPPLLRDLHAVLRETPGALAEDLAARLSRFVDGSLASGMLAGPTNVTLDRHLVVFNIRDLEDELRPLAIHLIAGFVWNRVRRERRPRLLVIDEAWSLLRYAEGGAFVSAMARRARKYYLGLVIISQDVADVLGSPQGRAVLVNSAMKLLLKQDASTIDAVQVAFRLTADERQQLLGADKGEGLLFVRGSHVPLLIEGSRAEHRLATTAPRELAALALDARPSAPATNGHVSRPGLWVTLEAPA